MQCEEGILMLLLLTFRSKVLKAKMEMFLHTNVGWLLKLLFSELPLEDVERQYTALSKGPVCGMDVNLNVRLKIILDRRSDCFTHVESNVILCVRDTLYANPTRLSFSVWTQP
jgi:hypothetical protein